MIERIVEIATDSRHIAVFRGFLEVRPAAGCDDQAVGRVPIDDVGALIVNAHGVTYSNNVLVALAERGAPVVFCGDRHDVKGVLWPLNGHHVQGRRIDAQLAASKPLRKGIWAQLVRAKLMQQAATLASVGRPSAVLRRLAKGVRSGDPDNREAQGARFYWPLLLGKDFRRSPTSDGANALLNYGYTVLRSCVARAVVAAGLHPSLGVHHSSDSNPLRLVDDFMEPFRPVVDRKVHALVAAGSTTVDRAEKRSLAEVVYEDLLTAEGERSPLTVCAQRLAVSYVQRLLGERGALALPMPGVLAQAAAKLPSEPPE